MRRKVCLASPRPRAIWRVAESITQTTYDYGRNDLDGKRGILGVFKIGGGGGGGGKAIFRGGKLPSLLPPSL